MNPMIAALLGGGMGNVGAAASEAGRQQMPPPQEHPGIEVSNGFNSKMREGLVKGGFFGMGRTGGNILGTIGDALLIGGGKDPIYQPRLREARTNEALEEFDTDWDGSMKRLAQVDAGAAVELDSARGEAESKQALEAARVRDLQDEYNNVTHDRALAYLGAATDKSYPQVRGIIEKWYADRGVEPMFELPETYDPDMARSLAGGAVPMKDQATIAQQERNNASRLEQARMSDWNRNYRMGYQEFKDDERLERTEEGRNSRVQTMEAGRDRRDGGGGARGGASGTGRPAGSPRVVRDANGKVRIIRQ